jgi:hypothetical protein
MAPPRLKQITHTNTHPQHTRTRTHTRKHTHTHTHTHIDCLFAIRLLSYLKFSWSGGHSGHTGMWMVHGFERTFNNTMGLPIRLNFWASYFQEMHKVALRATLPDYKVIMRDLMKRKLYAPFPQSAFAFHLPCSALYRLSTTPASAQ